MFSTDLHSTNHPHADQPQAIAADGVRGALALGLVGSLGEELLALMVSGIDYAYVHVAVTTPLASTSARFRPWKIGGKTIVVDDAVVALTDDTTVVPSASPIARFYEPQLLDAARIAQSCGARRLIVIAPLAALLQLNEAARTLAPDAELALRAMGFERLLIVRPTAADTAHTGGLRGVFAAMGRAVADIMLPRFARVLSARTAAAAIAQAARNAPPGVTVLGARELLQIVDAQFPALAPKPAKIR